MKWLHMLCWLALCAGLLWSLEQNAGAQVVSREFSVSNFSPPGPILSAVSREFSVSNFPSVLEVAAAVSREFSVSNTNIPGLVTSQAFSREFTVYMPPYSPAEAASALRIAAGLNVTTDPVVMDRLNIIHVPSSPGIDMLDALAVTRLAAVAPPP